MSHCVKQFLVQIYVVMLLSCLKILCLTLDELKNLLFFMCFKEALLRSKFENQVEQFSVHSHVEDG